jgi:hypothetical protein
MRKKDKDRSLDYGYGEVPPDFTGVAVQPDHWLVISTNIYLPKE